MYISYGYPRALKAEKITAQDADLHSGIVTLDTCGLSAQIKMISGGAHVCGKGGIPSENAYTLSEGEILCFSGVLKILPQSDAMDARILYFDSI